jgi:tetratricopeptide (TPR) repeat protein
MMKSTSEIGAVKPGLYSKWSWYRQLSTTVLLVLTALTFSSCSDLAGGFSVLAANRQFEEGRIHDAIAGYHQLGVDAFDGLVAYNLANAFMALGEFASAEPLFSMAAESSSSGIAARALFNLGVALYARGDFPGAASSFRRSLEARPSDREVSRAYEMALNASRAVQSVSDKEQARFQSSKAGGDQSMFGMAMPAPRPFFVPGGGPGTGGVDH